MQFTEFEKDYLTSGNLHRVTLRKLTKLSLQWHEHYAMFRWYAEFLETLPGEESPSAAVQHQRVVNWAKERIEELRIRDEKERKALVRKTKVRAEVTPSGYVFYGDDLIAL